MQQYRETKVTLSHVEDRLLVPALTRSKHHFTADIKNHSDLSPRCEFDIVGLFENIATVKDMKTTNTSHIWRKKTHCDLVVDDTNDDGTIEKSYPPPTFSYEIAEVFKNLATVTDMKTSNNFVRSSC